MFHRGNSGCICSYISAFGEHNKKSEELRQFISDNTQLDMKKVDFQKIREILRTGIVKFSELRDQWAKMVLFFQKTSSIIDVCLNTSVTKLCKQLKVSSAIQQQVGWVWVFHCSFSTYPETEDWIFTLIFLCILKFPPVRLLFPQS